MENTDSHRPSNTTRHVETLEEITEQRDALLHIEGKAQKREEHLKRTIQLLILAGHVDQKRVDQAKDLACPQSDDSTTA